MKHFVRHLLFVITMAIPIFGSGLSVGIGKADITPPIGTPSAGYADRKGEGMEGVHDLLLAIALFIDNGDKKIALCSVDHLGFTWDMVREITEKVHADPFLSECEIYIGSSHTHSGGGAYLDIPVLGESLAGSYSPKITGFYIEKTAQAIIEASKNLTLGRIGIGYGQADHLSVYRSFWPEGVDPLCDVAIIKVTDLDDVPLAVLFNYPVHPTVLGSQNRQFSSDFVGYAREHVQNLLGQNIQTIYFNGAQGDINPIISNDKDHFVSCEYLGKSLAKTVQEIWDRTKASDALHIKTAKESYSFQPQATPFGLVLPIDHYESEMNGLVLNHLHAFVTIPGELSCVYDKKLKKFGKDLGFSHVSIFGLTNDAHGYMILPESWRHKTMESGLSFGGENYGNLIEAKAKALLRENAP